MKKLAIILTTFTLVLVGCGAESSGEVKGEITVGIWGTPSEIQLMEEQTAAFEAETGVEVTLKQYTDFETEIQAELIGGVAPDVFYVDAYMFPFFVEEGILEPYPEDLDTSDYQENLIQTFEQDGVLYALPKDYSTLAIYYNKEYVNPEELPESYEELEAYLTELATTLPEDVCPMTYNIDLSRQMALAQSGGLSIVDENGYATLTDPAMVENLAIEYDLAEKDLMCAPTDYGFNWNGEIFGNGSAAIMLEGNWVRGELDTNYPDIDYGTTENFTVNGEQQTMMFAVGWGVNAASDNKDAAFAYVEYMNRPENSQVRSEQTGVLSPLYSVNEAMNVEEDPIMKAHYDGSSYATPWQAGTTLSTINTEYQNYLPSVASGDMELEEALEKAETEANKIIEASQ